MWVKDYAAAKIKKQWGQNMTKFQNVQMPGGVTLNGEMIYNDAVQELKDLDEQLRNRMGNSTTRHDRIVWHSTLISLKALQVSKT